MLRGNETATLIPRDFEAPPLDVQVVLLGQDVMRTPCSDWQRAGGASDRTEEGNCDDREDDDERHDHAERGRSCDRAAQYVRRPDARQIQGRDTTRRTICQRG